MLKAINKSGRRIVAGDIVKARELGTLLPDTAQGLYCVVTSSALHGDPCDYVPYEVVEGWTGSKNHIMFSDGRSLITARIGCHTLACMRDDGREGRNLRRLILNGIELRFNTAAAWGNTKPVLQADWAERIDFIVNDD